MDASFLGIAYDQAMAGTVGGVVSLAFLRDLTPLKVWLAIFTGFACAAYLTSPLTRLLLAVAEKIIGPMKPAKEDPLAVAFMLGLMGMFIIAGLMKLAERFGADPLDLIRRLRNGT